MRNYKRLTLDDRILIQEGLNNNRSLNSIAKSINKALLSISREIKSHRIIDNRNPYGRLKNKCINRNSCKRNDLCVAQTYICKNRLCTNCRKCNCNLLCNNYQEEICNKLSSSPYVCNSCGKRSKCTLNKYFYKASYADTQSKLMLAESRKGLNLTEEEIKSIDEIISPKIKQGQSIHNIFTYCQEELTICEKTAYTLLHAGFLTAIPLDAPRIMRLSPRKNKSKEVKVDKKCRQGRTYKDYLIHMELHPDSQVLQGDTVEGIKGGKCILTLTWVQWSFQIGILRDCNNSSSVTEIVNYFYELLGVENFLKIFPDVWLLDNGSEFSNPTEIEKYGIHVFYCDPGMPSQKGTCEVTHELLRRILTKGTSFNNLNQAFFNLIYSHINSYKRKKLNDLSPIEAFSRIVGEQFDLESIFNIKKIDPSKVVLSKTLYHNYLKSK